jgi:hypothetical protein
MCSVATVRPHSTRVESARGVGGVASICDDPVTTTVSVPACIVRVRAPSLGVVWYYSSTLRRHVSSSFPVEPITCS